MEGSHVHTSAVSSIKKKRKRKKKRKVKGKGKGRYYNFIFSKYIPQVPKVHGMMAGNALKCLVTLAAQ